jgi:hypothetical protein
LGQPLEWVFKMYCVPYMAGAEAGPTKTICPAQVVRIESAGTEPRPTLSYVVRQTKGLRRAGLCPGRS